jgi:hypothetical protein
MTQQPCCADGGIRDRGETKTVKRRGILAAAGAVVAGIAMKQGTQSVAAGTDGDVVLGSSANIATRTTGISNKDNSGGFFAAIAGFRSTSLTDLTAGDVGVLGFADLEQGIGMRGICDAAFGVGVQGNSATFYGVNGATLNGVGVVGDVYQGAAGTSNIGVIGRVGVVVPNAQSGTTAVYGQNNATGANNYGVYGTATHGYGVVGNTTAAGYSGLTGITSTPGVAALAATSTVANAYAAYFSGMTVVQGNFYVVSGAKSAAVPHPDGSHRAVYCVESPESWFEDFGEARLVGGKATVALDADFAAIVHTAAYHAFLAPGGDCKGLYVASKGVSAFEVRELQGGASTLTFSWRVVARRKDIDVMRLAKVDLPKINHPDPAGLPKAPAAKP